MANVVDYAVGQCTWFVSHALGYLGISNTGALGDAYQWLANAKAKGLPTSLTPEIGSAVVYKAGTYGSAAGHVAVVTGVNPNGTFTVAEDNWGGVGHTNIRTSTMAGVEGFILPPSAQAGVTGAALAMKEALAHPSLATQQSQSADAASPWSVQPGTITSPHLDTVWNKLGLPDLNPIDILQRGGLIIFGLVIVAIGLLVIFKVEAGSPSAPATETEVLTTESRDPEGTLFTNKTTSKRTKTPAKKGRGVRGRIGK